MPRTGPLPRPLARGRSSLRWEESKPESRSRLQLARDEVGRIFGDGHAAAHPELVVAIVHAASSDWAGRVISAGLQDIAVALVEGGVALPGNASLVAARSIVRP